MRARRLIDGTRRWPDGRFLLASGSADGTVRLRDPATGAVVGALLAGPRGRAPDRSGYPDRPTASHCVRHADGGQQVRERTDVFRAY